MWQAILEGLGLFKLLFNYWITGKEDEQKKKDAYLAYTEAREKFTAGLSARFYRESQRQKEALKEKPVDTKPE